MSDEFYKIYLKNIAGSWEREGCKADQAIVFSPYITSIIEKILKDIEPNKVEIYTLFYAELFINMSSSISTLVKLKKSGTNIYSLPDLHAKIIIFPDTFASIGSQNVTTRGTQNLECSVIFSDPTSINNLRSELNTWIAKSSELSLNVLEKMERVTKPYIKNYKKLRSDYEKIDSEINKIEQESTPNFDLKSAIINIKKRHHEIYSGSITRETAQKLIKHSAWWHTHSSGKPVRASGHAENIYHDKRHGWVIDFGANTFLISKAISTSMSEIDIFLSELAEEVPLDFNNPITKGVFINKIVTKIKPHIRRAVANYDGNQFEYPLSGRGQDMMFGAQSINVEEAAFYIISLSGATSILFSSIN